MVCSKGVTFKQFDLHDHVLFSKKKIAIQNCGLRWREEDMMMVHKNVNLWFESP